MRGEPGFLRSLVDTQHERPVEQIQQLALVPGDAADEHRPAKPGEDLFQPRTAPYPAMRAEPLPIRLRRPAHPPPGGIFPLRQLRVLIRIDGHPTHASTTAPRAVTPILTAAPPRRSTCRCRPSWDDGTASGQCSSNDPETGREGAAPS